jgi:hypothetical protein
LVPAAVGVGRGSARENDEVFIDNERRMGYNIRRRLAGFFARQINGCLKGQPFFIMNAGGH